MKKGTIVLIIVAIVIIIGLIAGLGDDKSGGMSSFDYGDDHYYDSNSGQVERLP